MKMMQGRGAFGLSGAGGRWKVNSLFCYKVASAPYKYFGYLIRFLVIVGFYFNLNNSFNRTKPKPEVICLRVNGTWTKI